MTRLLSLLVLASLAAALPANEPLLVPTFSNDPVPTPAPGVQPIATSTPVIVAKQPLPEIEQVSDQLAPIPMQVTHTPMVVPLYHNVKVRTPGRMDPCAVPQIIQVPNPCQGRCDPVFVKICVPPCQSPCMTIGRFGRVTYDFGKFRVQVASRNGLVIVDYDA